MNNNDMDQKAKELQNVLEQFYSTTDNPKRKEIDTILNNYKAQSDSYEHVKYYLVHSDSQYVIWFSLSIIEEKVNKSWNNVSSTDQLHVKNLLLDLYLNKTNSTAKNTFPAFIFTKLGQVIADIGRYEFEINPQNYLLSITNIVRNPATTIRGINLLQSVSESFRTNKKVISQQKKNILQKLLHQNSPIIIQVLTEYLGTLFDQNAEKKFKQHQNLIHFQVGSPDTNTYTASFSAESKGLTKAVFDALKSYFSWLPLGDLLQASLFDILFKYLRLEKNSVPALECLNEIVSKNLVPKGFEQFLIRIFHQIYSLLTEIVSNGGSQINQYPSDFLLAFTQFIQLFVSNHLARVESNPQFPISDFLGLLFQYSFLQSTSESFLQCIDIWSTFLDYLIKTTFENGDPTSSKKYIKGLLALQEELIKRILYAYGNNNSILDDLDDEDKELNENGLFETQLESYIKKCIEVVAKVTELYPEESLPNLYPLFTQNVTSFFCNAEESIKQGSFMDDVNSVKDVTTILQLFGRLVDQFVSSFAQHFTPANFIFQKLLDMCLFTVTNFTFKNGIEWEKLQIQLLCTIRSFSFWLSEYGNQVRAVVSQQPDFDSNITKLINIIVRLFERNVPEEVSIEAARLLMSLVVITKPLNLFTQMDMLIGNIHNICIQLPTSVQSIIYPAISSSILLPPSNVNLSQQWDQRRPKYSPFIKGITAPFLEIPQISGFVEDKIFCKEEYIQRVLKVLKIVTAIIKAVPDSTMAKGILHDGIQDTLQVTLGLFRIYINYPNVLEAILDFFFGLFEYLKTQVGVVFTQQTITTFLEILGGDNLNQLLSSGNEVGISIIKKLIEILTFVAQQTGGNFESLLGSTIEFSMDKVYPLIANSTSVLKPSLFTLLYSILDNHWKHCQATQIQNILMAFQSTFQQNDVNLFKQNLENFEKLNSKLKLYEKIASLERSYFGCSFISMFFDVLISDTQNIHTDDIVTTIYKFASLDFDKFFNDFFNSYLVQKNQISNEQKQILRSNFSSDRDQPTFTTNMTQFINDFSYFTFINS